jgi:hypothetical protein
MNTGEIYGNFITNEKRSHELAKATRKIINLKIHAT